MKIEEGIAKMREYEKTCLTWDKKQIDKESIHPALDEVLLAFVPEEIRNEYMRIEDKVGGFWYA